MFRRPALYHPYKPSGPAGFRIKDLFPKRCFNLFPGLDFANGHSPDPSPLSSPVRGTSDSKDGAPPTLRLADLFAACFGESPQRPTTPAPSKPRQTAQPSVVRAKDALPKPQPRRKGKHLSFANLAQRPRNVPPHRRSQHLKRKREVLHERKLDAHERRVAKARDDMCRFVEEAKVLMKPEHMTRGDFIFLKQLKNLAFDQEMDHALERSRALMARAAAETEQRRQAHEARDREAERLQDEQSVEEAEEKQKKKTEEFVKRYKEEMLAEAMRVDERRQRAHEEVERKVREERQRQERELRIRQERERKAKEEEERRLQEEKRRQEQEEMIRQLLESIERARGMDRERRKREEQERRREEEASRQRQQARERFIREEQERHAQHWQDQQARRAAAEQQISEHFALYEGKWNELRTSNTLPPIDVRDMPWPVMGVVSSADQITYEAVRAFLFHPQRVGVQGKATRDKVKAEVLRFHPDKFDTRIVPKIIPSQQAVAQEIAGAIARILTKIMAEVE